MNSKLHTVTDAKGRPIRTFLSAGQTSDFTGAAALVRSLPKAGLLLADRGYDANWFRNALRDMGIQHKPIFPQIAFSEQHLLQRRHHSISKDLERAHPDKWLTYLRLLDARVSGASWQKCADSIVPKITAKLIGTARDQHKQALRLQAYL